MKSKSGTFKHGELLQKLIDWYPKSIKDFSKAVGYSATIIYRLKNQEIISQKALHKISRAMNIDLAYWDGNYDLPLKLMNEPGAEYTTVNKVLHKEIKQLKEENLELNKTVLKLQKRIIDMQDQLLNFLPASPQKSH